MRTHLLHTVLIPPAAEPDTGVAANDTEYDRRNVVALVPPATTLNDSTTTSRSLAPEDEYTLGGYAGI
jgi:hypothetical protein